VADRPWEVSARPGVLRAREVLDRPARPHLASTGRRLLPTGEGPPRGRGWRSRRSPTARRRAPGPTARTATLAFAGPRAPASTSIIAAAVTTSADPLAVAAPGTRGARPARASKAGGERRAWWSDYWDARSCAWSVPIGKRTGSAPPITSPLHACVRQPRPCPAKWDGGPGLMRGDDRNWGLSEWVQEIRSPTCRLHAAEAAGDGPGTDPAYSAMVRTSRADQEDVGAPRDLDPRATLLGPREDVILVQGAGPRATTTAAAIRRGSPSAASTSTTRTSANLVHRPRGVPPLTCEEAPRRRRGVRPARAISGDPRRRGVRRSLLRKECRRPPPPRSATTPWETCGGARSPEDPPPGIRAIFPEFIRLSKARPDAGLAPGARRCCLAPGLPPSASGRRTGKVEFRRQDRLRSRLAREGGPPPRPNSRIRRLYGLPPSGSAGTATPDFERARGPSERRICGWPTGGRWTPSGPPGSACERPAGLAAEHADLYNRFR